MNDSGFTLIETLTVFAIVAILSATSIPVFRGFIEDAKRKAYVSEAYLVMAAAQTYIVEARAEGELDGLLIYEDISQYEVSDPANALYGVLKDSVTKGASIELLNYDTATAKVSGISYCVKNYRIEIDYDSEVKISVRN